MLEQPSFRRRVDSWLLAIALLTPWILGGLAYAGPLVGGWLYRGEFRPEWLGPVVSGWFYTFGFPAMISPVAWFLFGVWRLVWRPAYMRSWFGWLWLFLMWVNLCLVGPVIGH